MKTTLFILFTILATAISPAKATEADKPKPKTPAMVNSRIGQKVTASDRSLVLTCIERRGSRHSGKHYDADIVSPKSATFSADGKKLYVNSLEGGTTVVYDAQSLKKLKVIQHRFKNGNSPLWLPESGYYKFTHYTDGASRAFFGKPVEEAISRDGRWLFVPYYRRSFDINAQDPSALAIIDTRTDSIVAMTETGPLPKMVRVSNDGRLLAITHWGDNTVGFLDISDPDPRKWHHLPPVTIGNKLNLNYSLTTPVNRDSGSGYLLRGTVFLPGDSLLLVSGMAGPMAVIDTRTQKWIGMIPSLGNVRHIAMADSMLYFSRNTAGEVMTVPVSNIVSAIASQRDSSRSFSVSGVKSVKVGGGARTLKPSPSGKYIFVACNSASALYVVRSSDMKVIASIPIDSYPVGLDVAADGTLVALTSQGRRGIGGNSVNFVSVEYAEPEPVKLPLPVNDSVKTDTLSADTVSAVVATPSSQSGDSSTDWQIPTVITLSVAAVGAGIYYSRKKTV